MGVRVNPGGELPPITTVASRPPTTPGGESSRALAGEDSTMSAKVEACGADGFSEGEASETQQKIFKF